MVGAVEQFSTFRAESTSNTAIPYYCSMILNARYRLRNASILTSFSCSHTTQYRTRTSTCTFEACTVQYLYLYSYQYLRYEYLYRYEYIYGMQELNFAEIIIPVLTTVYTRIIRTRTGGARIRFPLFCGGCITRAPVVCLYSDRSHFEGTAAVCITSEGFRLEFPSA